MANFEEFIKSNNLLTLLNEDLNGKNVLIKVDFNCSIKNGKAEENYRIKETLDTLNKVKEKNPKKIVLLTHLGRPEGKFNKDLSVEPLRVELENLWREKVKVIPYLEDFKEYAKKVQEDDSQVILWENVRFWKGEEENDPEFSKSLALGMDVYINEAFSASHREHASVVGTASLLPAYAGIQLGEEVRTIYQFMTNSISPSVAIVGGAKIDTKIPVIRALSKYYDTILLGGKVAIEWEESKGKYKEDWIEKLVLPSGYKEDDMCDINKESAENFAKIIKTAKKILWNGPMGKFEDPDCRMGTEVVAQAITKNGEAKTIVGGGETVAFLDDLGLKQKIGFVSTGGGAMLEYIAKNTLPGISNLTY